MAAAPQLSKPKPAPAKKPTRADFERWLELDAQRKEHGRQAAALSGQQNRLGESITAYVLQDGGKHRTVECSGHRAEITSKQGQPSWLQEFTELAGQAKVDELKSSAPFKDSLTILKL
ncbi:MAG: hypothetical protein H0T51_07910 [Pirellulales bacterium]|nr:hypothetical protein [Pirellulales bacterium]